MQNYTLSPLTNTPSPLLRTFSCEQIAESWKSTFGIQVPDGWSGVSELKCYECPDTKLRFFQPSSLEGDGRLYAKLQEFQWYYMESKWEYDVAMKDLPGVGSRILEVGCGGGAFVNRLFKAGYAVQGIELNPSAVAKARSQKLPVELLSLSDIKSGPQKFDAVCHFEVLEHVNDVRGFLEDCIDCVRPGGRLIFALPCMDGFLGEMDKNLLNMPPHHMTQWFAYTVRSLERFLPIRLIRQEFEPLASYHAGWYLNHKMEKLGAKRGLRRCVPFLRALATLLLRFDLTRKCIRGHTQYACFEVLDH